MPYQDVFTTRAGMTWDLVSYLVYGDERYMTNLIEANPEHRRTAIFEGGVQLVCPDIDVEQSGTLPPWET